MKTKTHIVEKNKSAHIVNELANNWGLPVAIDCRRTVLQLPEEIGTGRFVAYDSNAGVNALILEGTLNEDFNLKLIGDYPDPISFYVQATGETEVSSDQMNFSLLPLQSTIHGGFGRNDYQLSFPKDTDILFMVVFIHKNTFFDEIDCETLHVPDNLLKVIVDENNVNTEFLFQDIFHLPTVNALRAIVQQEDPGLLHHAFASGKIYEIIFLQINLYRDYLARPNPRLMREEARLRPIRLAARILRSDLQDPPTIPELARLVGINQQSLKKGFRQLYGVTVNQYLNNRRMEIAGELLRKGDFSIRQVALRVGYGNPGYFSRRFREQYGVSPRNFAPRERVV